MVPAATVAAMPSAVPTRMPEAAVPAESLMPSIGMAVAPSVAGNDDERTVEAVRPAPAVEVVVEAGTAPVAARGDRTAQQDSRREGCGHDKLADHLALHGRPAAGRTRCGIAIRRRVS